MILRNEGKTQFQIAESIGRKQSTISRELSRNSAAKYTSCYSAVQAHKRYENRKIESHFKERIMNPKIRLYVEKKLKLYLTPELISGRMNKEHPDLMVSHETIYMWIYIDRPDLIKFLWYQRKKRRKRHSALNKRAIRIQNRKMIDERPASAEKRSVIGHFEIDTVISRESKYSLVVIHERSSRMTYISRIKEKTADEVEKAVVKKLLKFPAKFRKTLTFDNGTENANHVKIGKHLKMKTYFCNPYHSWEKGGVEHVIGRIRFFLPKKTDFDKVSDKEIKQIEKWLNNRPRKVLDYNTPLERLKYALTA
jgi:IS30 family transposase